MKKTFLILLAVTTLFAACKTSGNQREKRLKEIAQAEQKFFSKNFTVTMEESQHLMDLYLAFADAFPQDSLTPEMLFGCANIAIRSQQELYAVTLYKRVYDEYPNHALRPLALIQQAVVYDNLGDIDHAKPLYEQFLVMFPDDPFATEVKHLLDILGKSPEELETYWQQDSIMNLN